jgi:signal transduction histidine kinase
MPATPLVPRRFSLSRSTPAHPDSQPHAPSLEAQAIRKLQRIVDSALSHLELDALLDELVARIQEALEVDTCVILLLDEARSELVATAARGLEEEVERGVRVPLGRGFAGRVASERQPVVLDDLEHADIVNPLLREKGLQSLLGAPLLVRGHVLGVVHVGSLEPREFSLADIDLLQLAASRAALAIGHSRAYEAERRARAEVEASRERLAKLQSITDAALAYLELDELLAELTARISNALEVDTCAILLLDQERNELVARAARGLEEEVELSVRIPVGKGFAGRVAAERRPVVLDDVNQGNVLNPLLREKGVKSLLGAPLLTRGRVLGVVHVGCLRHRRFLPEDVELLQLAADRAALGLERALVHEQLLRLEELKQEFVATAAHELRTPASVLIGVAMTLRERSESLSEDTRTQLLELLYDASTRLGNLLEELLDFSRVESRMLVTESSAVTLRPLLEDVGREVAPAGIEGLEVEVPHDFVLVTDESILRRVLANLLKNALVHGKPPICVHVDRGEDHATLTIEDRGPGVPQAFVDRLFDPFSRASPAEGKPGAGLGLAIAHSYSRRLGGELTYESAEPTGARFSLRLPQPASAHA